MLKVSTHCGSSTVLYSLGVDGKNNNLKKIKWAATHSGRFWTDPFKVTVSFYWMCAHVHLPCTCVLNRASTVSQRDSLSPWNIPILGVFHVNARRVKILKYLAATASLHWKKHKTAFSTEILSWRQCSLSCVPGCSVQNFRGHFQRKN